MHTEIFNNSLLVAAQFITGLGRTKSHIHIFNYYYYLLLLSEFANIFNIGTNKQTIIQSV